MYGMVNMAIEQMVVGKFGEDTWKKIKDKAGVSDVTFITMQSYDDKITYALVRAASEILNIEGAELLEKFGEYWILHTANAGYGDMLKMGGDNLPDFLKNLDMLHFKVGAIMPQLVPPSFEVKDVTAKSLTLLYRSKRDGFVPMVIGLVKGLGLRFNTPCSVTYIKFEEEEFAHCFKVNW